MKNRIKQIIEQEHITYSKLADILQIQRSGISHILNGRNKPSLEFIQKILESFPYINSDWLLFGTEPMRKTTSDNQKKILFENDDTVISDFSKTEIKYNNQKSADSFEHVPTDKKPFNSQRDKKIERVVIFYSDKTFSEYIPE
jgi:transcriptional regulator with XRE-family HTH domain